MAVTRNSLKNKFISVNNNFSSSLRGRISNSTLSIAITTTPTKLGNFGYVTVDNSNGGQVIFYSSKSSNTLYTVTQGRGTDGTVARGARGGTLVQQRVIASNVSQNQAALISLLRVQGNSFSLGARASDPNRQQFTAGNNGYTGYDNQYIRSVLYNSTSAQYSIGGQIKKYFDKYYVNRNSYSGDVIGSSMNDALTIQCTYNNQYPIKDIVTTAGFNATTDTSLEFGAGISSLQNRLKTPAVGSSALTAYTINNRGRSFISSRRGSTTSAVPLVVAAQDIIFLQKYRNIHSVVDSATLLANDQDNGNYGSTLNTSSTSLQNKVQLFNVRSSSIYQPYTVVSTHYDSRIDSQLLRKDSDFFLSTYNSSGNEAGSGGTLSLRRSIGSGVSGDRWRLAYNQNMLVDGRTFRIGKLNEDLDGYLSNQSFRWNILDDTYYYSIPQFQSLVNRGWTNIFNTAVTGVRGNVRNNQVGIQGQCSNFITLTGRYTGYGSNQRHVNQFISYSQSCDKILNLRISFHGFTGSSYSSQINFSSMSDFNVGLIPIYYTPLVQQYTIRYGNKIIISNFNRTSILSSSSGGYLYSATRQSSSMLVSNSISRSDKLVGFFFVLGFRRDTDTTNNITVSQIKLQQGLQVTRYVENRDQNKNKTFFYNKDSQGIVIGSKQLNNTNLFVAIKDCSDLTSKTASVDFGKYIPYGWEGQRPYLNYKNVFWKYVYDDNTFQDSHGGSLIYKSCTGTDNLIPSIFKSVSPSYSQNIYGLKTRGRGVELIQSNKNSGNPDCGVYIYTLPPINTTGNLGNISISARGSTRSKAFIYSSQLSKSNYNLSASAVYTYITDQASIIQLQAQSTYANQIQFGFKFITTSSYSKDHTHALLLVDDLPMDIMLAKFDILLQKNNNTGLNRKAINLNARFNGISFDNYHRYANTAYQTSNASLTTVVGSLHTQFASDTGNFAIIINKNTTENKCKVFLCFRAPNTDSDYQYQCYVKINYIQEWGDDIVTKEYTII